MKQLNVLFSGELNYSDAPDRISSDMDMLERYWLANTPWGDYSYKPEVQFAIAHSNDCIFLKFYVKEKVIRAAASDTNGSVWEDACVEFFVGFSDEGYYNLEFNCIGTALVGYGKEKVNRELLPKELVRRIKFHAGICNDLQDDTIHWELLLVIPVSVFRYHPIDALTGIQCRANFYKCGDHLPEPHFVTWSDIQAPTPNFHLPQFFGSLTFE